MSWKKPYASDGLTAPSRNSQTADLLSGYPLAARTSHWTKLNMDRCMDLEDRGLMTPAGRRAFENAY